VKTLAHTPTPSSGCGPSLPCHHTSQGNKRAAQLAVAQAAALAGAKRIRTDAEVDASDPGVEVAPGAVKRRVINPHKPVLDGTASAENISQVNTGLVGRGAVS
jgi:hypothetical protein